MSNTNTIISIEQTLNYENNNSEQVQLMSLNNFWRKYCQKKEGK